MRASLSIAIILLGSGLTAAAAQDTTSRVTTLTPGTPVRYQLTGDTSWARGRIAGIGSCIGIVPAGQDTAAAAAGGFFVVSLSAVQRLAFHRRHSTDSTWVAMPEPALARLRACTPGP